jgi:hypothetical protein
VARVLKLLDEFEESEEPKEPEVPQVKRRKLVRALDPEQTPIALTEPALKATKDKGGSAALLAAQRKIGPKLVISPVATYEALRSNEPIAVKPLTEVPLPSTSAIPFIAIPMDSVSPRLSGPNIQHILEDIEMKSEDSVAGGPNQTEAPVLVQEKESRPWALLPIAEARS